MKTFFFQIILIAALFISSCSKEAEEKTKIGDIYVPVKVKTIELKTVEKTFDFGTILSPVQEAAIDPQFSAWVRKINVKEGDFVRKGQLLVVLDDAQARQADAQFEATRREYERVKSLQESGTATKQQLDQVEAAYLASKAGTELIGSNTNIRAPFDGVVADINVEVGEAFSPMSMKPSILTVMDVSSMKAEVRISDAQLGKIAKGQKAHIKLDAFPDSIFDGVVLNVEPSADVASGTFKVVVAIPNAKKLLKKGFYARVNIVTESRDSALSVPQDAIVADTLVFVANGDKAQARRIKIAFENTNEAVVDSGISAGESVIYEGVIGLFDGAPIKIEN